MSDPIRLDLTGRNSRAWNRVFDTLTSAVESAVDNLMPDAPDEIREEAKDLAGGIAEITKDWLKAKLERPALENELKIVEIAAKFEELKVQRQEAEVNLALKKVELDERRLDLWEKRLTLALRWLGFFQRNIIREADGSVVLLLTGENMGALMADLQETSVCLPESEGGLQ